jgi:hypothetical protein
MATFAPWAANSLAVANPIPALPPVITATLFSNFNDIFFAYFMI